LGVGGVGFQVHDADARSGRLGAGDGGEEEYPARQEILPHGNLPLEVCSIYVEKAEADGGWKVRCLGDDTYLPTCSLGRIAEIDSKRKSADE